MSENNSLNLADLHLDSRFVHGGVTRDVRTGASSVPIYQCSTFHQHDPLQLGEYDYARSGNPTRHALEQAIADLEGGVAGYAFASGLAAICSTLMMFRPGDHIVVCEDVYGGTFRALTKLFREWQLELSFVDTANAESFAAAIQPNTRALYVETPSNPLLKVTDLAAIVRIAQQHNVLSIVDNTFMSPALQRPIQLGFDIVLHSATKFLGGHSDVVAGLAVVKDAAVGQRIQFVQNAFGAILGPQDSWLIMRGMKTLGVRMARQQATAQLLAQWLSVQPSVLKVHYPGLESHPGYAVQQSQADGPGAVLSFELPDEPQAVHFMKQIKLPLVGVSLGGIETIVSYPTTMSHAAMPAPERIARGISPGLVRVSVGLEDYADLHNDFAQAFLK